MEDNCRFFLKKIPAHCLTTLHAFLYFAWVCERLNASPHETLTVGDTSVDDYAGALASGLNALHLDRPGAARARGAPTIRTLDEILPALRVQSDSVATARRDRSGCRAEGSNHTVRE